MHPLEEKCKQIDIPLCSILQHWHFTITTTRLLPFTRLRRKTSGKGHRCNALLLRKQKYLTYKLKISIHFVNTVVIINIFTANLLKVIWISGQNEASSEDANFSFTFFFLCRNGLRERTGECEREAWFTRHRKEQIGKNDLALLYASPRFD